MVVIKKSLVRVNKVHPFLSIITYNNSISLPVPGVNSDLWFLVVLCIDESTELQTRICNTFKSLVIQLQGNTFALFM